MSNPPKIWRGLETQLRNTLTETIRLYEELLSVSEESATEAERAEWHAQLRNARAELRELEERVYRRPRPSRP